MREHMDPHTVKAFSPQAWRVFILLVVLATLTLGLLLTVLVIFIDQKTNLNINGTRIIAVFGIPMLLIGLVLLWSLNRSLAKSYKIHFGKDILCITREKTTKITYESIEAIYYFPKDYSLFDIQTKSETFRLRIVGAPDILSAEVIRLLLEQDFKNNSYEHKKMQRLFFTRNAKLKEYRQAGPLKNHT